MLWDNPWSQIGTKLNVFLGPSLARAIAFSVYDYVVNKRAPSLLALVAAHMILMAHQEEPQPPSVID